MIKLSYLKDTIAGKILISFLVISLVPILFIGYITFRTSEEKIKQETLKNLMVIAESNAVSLNEYISGKEREAKELVFTPSIAEIFNQYHDAFQRGVNTEEYKAVERKHRKQFITYVNEFQYGDIMFVDNDGNVFFTLNNEDYFASNISVGPYRETGLAKAFGKTITSGKTVMSDLINYYPSYRPAAFISTPMIEQGSIIGAVILQLSNAGIYAVIQNYLGLGRTGEAVVASKKGGEAVFIAPLRHDPEAAFRRTVLLGSEEALPIQKAVLGESGSGISVDYRGKEILAVWRYLPELGWGMVTKIDTDEAYHHIYSLRNWVFFTGLATVIAVILIALRIARSIAGPIRALHEGSEIIGSGNLDYKVGTDSKDEIGELSRRFDQMTGNLKKVTASRDELNREISERKLAEKNLEKFRILFSKINDLAFICDDKGNFLFLNDAFETLSDHKPEEFIGKSFASLFAGENLEKAMDGYARTLNGESPKFEVAFKDTGTICEYKNMPLRDEQGNIIGVMGIARDITERKKIEEVIQQAKDELAIKVKEKTADLTSSNILLKKEIDERRQAEARLQENEERLSRFMDAAADGFILFDRELNYIEINRAALAITGLNRSDVIGGNILDVVPNAVESGRYDKYKEVIERGRPFHISDFVPHPKFGNKNIELKAFKVGDGLGIIFSDITERCRAEKMIKASLEEKEVLLQEIHHRVKNNLAVISSLLKLQSDKVRDKRYREMFHESMNRIKSMALIHEKLYRTEDLARINFSDYLNDMVDSMYTSYGLNPARVSLKKDINKVTLGVDASIPCGLIVNELLSNSLKYAFPDDRKGEIRIALHANNKSEVELIIGDNGVGIPEGLDFRTADSLGMNLVTSLVRQLHGEIELHGAEGAEFGITFRRRG